MEHSIKDMDESMNARETVYLGEVDISSPSDKKQALVCAMEVVSEGNLLVCDSANRKVKLFDEDSEVLAEVILTSEPRGMVTFNFTDVIVSLPNEKFLQNLHINNDNRIILQNTIKTNLRCSKLVGFEKHFIVYAYDDVFRYFNIMDRDGNEIRSVLKTTRDSTGMFNNVRFIALSTDNKVIYVTDAINGCVGLSLNGEIVFKMKENGTPNCWGVTTTFMGYVYIACYETNKIVMVDTKELLKDVVTQKRLRPCAIYFSKAEDRLYVKSGGANLVLIYEMKESS